MEKNHLPASMNFKNVKKAMLFTAFSTLFIIATWAQPVLQSANVQTGLSFNIYQLDNVNTANLSATGANATWDLSAATLGTLIGTADIIDMDSTGYALQYPTANYAMRFTQGGNVKYNLSRLTDTVLEEVAINVGTGGLQTFDNNRTDLPFPFTFNHSDTDAYQKHGQSGHTVTHTYDAYGTLTLSTGSINNLVRISSTDDGAGTSQVVWWGSSPVVPVLDGESSGVFLWQPANVTGINEINPALSFQIYPNPANNQLNIISGKPLNKIEIYDVTGKLQIIALRSVIDVSNLSSGVFIVKAFTDNNVEATKFIKQ